MNPSHTATAVTSPALPAPTRIATIDALRGFALFGILLVHCGNGFVTAGLPQSVYTATRTGAANETVGFISGVLLDGKFFTFFSFLFGLSFALMLTRSAESVRGFYGRFAWRLVVLGIIGFLHHLWWPGDILSIYAILGFALLALSPLPNRWVLVLAVLLTLNAPGRLYQIYTETTAQAAKPDKKQAAAKQKQEEIKQKKETETYYNVLRKSTFAERIKYNFGAFETKMRFQVESGRLAVTLGFFLFGLYAGRRNLFQRLAENRPFFRRAALFSGLTAIGVFLPALALFLVFNGSPQPPQWAIWVFQTIFDVFNTALTLFYITGLTVLFQQKWLRIVGPLASVGKMALTNYVLQSITGGLIFFGYGLNLLGTLQLWQCILLAFPILGLQIIFNVDYG